MICCTRLDDIKSPMPIGIKVIAIKKNVGNTVPAVKMGCQAGNFCCLKAESVHKKDKKAIQAR